MKTTGWTLKSPSASKLDEVELEGETYILASAFRMKAGVEYYVRFIDDGTAQLFELVDETPMVHK